MELKRLRAKYVSVLDGSERNVAASWKGQYYDHSSGWATSPKNCELIHKKLLALGPKPFFDDVDAVIGNNSWTRYSCDGCGEYTRLAISIGEYEPKKYCAVCIKEAAFLLDSVETPNV